ncbi:MAG: AraC family transcriptional regulator [Spirochaetales bacterium]|nr:AraC family transcriptional regulator [Spirochaetales bacterium]
MSNTAKTDYKSRINRVMDYIETHLHEDLPLARLADIACFSRFHFHRIFRSMTGERLAECIQRIRMEKAAALLKQNPGRSITGIAMLCGFASSASFANAFRNHFGMSASRYRNDPASGRQQGYIVVPEEEVETLDMRVEHHREKQIFHIKGKDYERTVSVVDLPVRHLAYVRYTGPYKGDSELFSSLWKRLMKWAVPHGVLNRPDSVYIALYHDNPEITSEENLRVSVCVSIDEKTEPRGEIGKLRLPGGKYAVGRFLLGARDYSAAWGWMYGAWLPASGYEPDDRPAFEWFPVDEEKCEGRMPVDICIPLKST